MSIGYRNYVKTIQNHRLKYLKKHKVKKENFDLQGDVVSGCGEYDYLFLIDYILTNKPTCIVEYGAGYSTWLIQELIADYNLDLYLISHEDNEYYFKWILENLHLSREVLNLTPAIACPDQSTDLYKVGMYNDNYEAYPDVDLIITDGPGPGPAGNFNVTDNCRVVCEYQNRHIPHWIDGRKITKQYYMELGYGESILHY